MILEKKARNWIRSFLPLIPRKGELYHITVHPMIIKEQFFFKKKKEKKEKESTVKIFGFFHDIVMHLIHPSFIS